MKLREAWKLSKTPYTEVTFRSIELTRGSSQPYGFSQDPVKRVNSVLRGAKISKIAFSVFIAIGALVPFAAFAEHRTPYALATSIVLSLAISLGYSVVYSFQVLPSFTQAGPYSLLGTLPLEEKDFSLISALSFLRTFDYMALSSIGAQVVIVGLLTDSIFAALLMFVAAAVNFTIGIALALWLSGLFYKNMTRGGRSRVGSVARFVFLITWGSVGLFFSLLFDFVNYVVPYVSNLLQGGLAHGAGVAVILVHPFSEAIAISSIVFSSSINGVVTSVLPVVYAATFGYVALAAFVGLRTQRTISAITHGQTVQIVRRATKNFQLKLRQPVLAYIVKDLRVASKNPQAAFIFVLPLFETVFIAISSSGLSLFGTSSIVSITTIGTFFTLFASSVLLNTEGYGLEYTMSLPLGARIIIFAKSAVATIAFLPVPAAILVLSSLRGGGQSLSILVPFVEIIAVSAATTAQLGFFITTQKRKMYATVGTEIRSEGAFTPTGFSVLSGRDMARFAKAMAVGIVVLYAPIIAYYAPTALGNSTLLSLLVMLGIAIAEVVIVQFVLKRSAYR